MSSSHPRSRERRKSRSIPLIPGLIFQNVSARGWRKRLASPRWPEKTGKVRSNDMSACIRPATVCCNPISAMSRRINNRCNEVHQVRHPLDPWHASGDDVLSLSLALKDAICSHPIFQLGPSIVHSLICFILFSSPSPANPDHSPSPSCKPPQPIDLYLR